MPEFNQEQHETALSRRYEQLAKFAAFDNLVDMALDGTITMDEAIKAYQEEVAVHLAELEGDDV